MKCDIHSTIFQCPKLSSPKWHTSIPVTEPKSGLWNNLCNIEKWYFKKSQITSPGVTHLYVIQTATILSPGLWTVIKWHWKKLKESEKISKILEQPLQYWTLYKVPKHPTWKETPQDQSNSQKLVSGNGKH